MSMLRCSMDVYVTPSVQQGSLLTKKQQGTKDSDQRAGVAELCPGDKVLVKLDMYQGARRKLVNRWRSTLHTLVRRVADDVPTYVIENAKGDRKVIHWVWLLLWSSSDKDQEGLQMTVDQLTIFVSLSALEPLLEGEKICRVPYEWSITGFSLNLAIFKLMLKVSELKTGPKAPATCADMPPQEGVGQWRKLGEETKSMGDGNTVLVGDTPPWIRTHRVEPNLLLPEGKMKRIELSIGDLALSYLISMKRTPIG